MQIYPNDWSEAVSIAICHEDREIVQALSSLLSQEERGYAVCLAAELGYLEILYALLPEGGEIAEEDPLLAVRLAQFYDHAPVGQFLLGDGTLLSEESRQIARREMLQKTRIELENLKRELSQMQYRALCVQLLEQFPDLFE